MKNMKEENKSKMVNSSTQLSLARELAFAQHEGQYDKLGQPYIFHVESVAKGVAHLGAEYETIAWLHDIVEDTDTTLDDIELQFGARVRRKVDAITQRPNEAYFETYIARLKQSKIAKQVKFADASHNLVRIPAFQAIDPDKAKALEVKYRALCADLKHK